MSQIVSTCILYLVNRTVAVKASIHIISVN